MGWDPIGDAKKWFNKAKDEANRGINTIRDGVNRGVREVEGVGKKAVRQLEGGVKKGIGEIEKGGKKAVSEVEGVGKKAVSEVEGAGKRVAREVEDGITEKLPDLILAALQELSSEAIKPALKAAAATAKAWRGEMAELREEDPELVGAIDALGFDVEVKVNVKIVLDWAGFYSRSEKIIAILDRAGNDGIALRRRDIIGFIEAIGPTSIKLGVGAEFSLGVEAGVSASLKAIPLKLFTRLGDRALKAAGVPA